MSEEKFGPNEFRPRGVPVKNEHVLKALLDASIADFTRLNDNAPLPHMFYDKDGLWKLVDGKYVCRGWEEQP